MLPHVDAMQFLVLLIWLAKPADRWTNMSEQISEEVMEQVLQVLPMLADDWGVGGSSTAVDYLYAAAVVRSLGADAAPVGDSVDGDDLLSHGEACRTAQSVALAVRGQHDRPMTCLGSTVTVPVCFSQNSYEGHNARQESNAPFQGHVDVQETLKRVKQADDYNTGDQTASAMTWSDHCLS